MRRFAPQTTRSSIKSLMCLHASSKLAFASYGLKDAIKGALLGLLTWSTVSYGQTGDTELPTAPAPQRPAGPVENEAPASDGLSDLSARTFSCVRAGLNAAAREAAKAPSQGSYQFSYFEIIKDTHHSFYEVHFKSNYSGEPDLKYCIAIYCQQGWDPNKAQISVSPMSNKRKSAQRAVHEAHCGNEEMRERRPPKL